MAGLRRFSQAISEGDGMSVIVHRLEPARGDGGDLPDRHARWRRLDSVLEVRAEEQEHVRQLLTWGSSC